MTKNQAFINSYDAALKQAGFKRNGMVYCRMPNPPILQVVFLRPFCFEVSYASDIAWSFFIDKSFESCVTERTDENWVLKSGNWFNNASYFITTGCISNDDAEMMRLAEISKLLFFDYIMPIFDRIRDVDSLISERKNLTKATCDILYAAPSVISSICPHFSENAFLYKAYFEDEYTEKTTKEVHSLIKTLLDERKREIVLLEERYQSKFEENIIGRMRKFLEEQIFACMLAKDPKFGDIERRCIETEQYIGAFFEKKFKMPFPKFQVKQQ